MPIDTLPAGSAGLSPGAPPSKRPGAPPGFSNALDDAAKTWTALAEGQTAPKKSHDHAISRTPSMGSGAKADADAPAAQAPKDKAVRADAARADVATPTDEAAEASTKHASGTPLDDAADLRELAKAIDAIGVAVEATPATPLPVAPVAVAATPAVVAPPTVDATGAAIDPAIAQLAVEVATAAAEVASGAPVDPAKPGVAELLSSLASGETSMDDLPADVQKLVAKATAEQASAPAASTAAAPTAAVPTAATTAAVGSPSETPAGDATNVETQPSVTPAAQPSTTSAAQPSTTPATQTTGAAATVASAAEATLAAAAAAQANGEGADAPAPVTMSPLAAAIQAVANAQSGAGQAQDQSSQPQQGQQPDGSTKVQPVGQGSPTAIASEAPAPTEAAVQGAAPIGVAQATSPLQSTAAAPAVPSIPVANPGQQAAAIEALVHLSKSSGKSHARIALAPEQLGGIQVTLIFGADGVTARLIAERPEAAAALNRAGQDLKDALQQQGIDLAGLETGFAGDGQRGASREAATSEAQRLAASRNASRQSDGEQTLHVALSEQPAPQVLAPGRTIDLRA